jgi:CBS domain-containing protein
LGLEGIGAKVQVRDIMSSPVITAKENDTIEKLAKLMDENDIGSVVVVDDEGKPLGIVTERDIMKRVVAKNILPSKFKAEDAMSSPLITVSPESDITEVARTMSRLKVRRLGVFYKGRLEGIISSKNVLSVTPELMEILTEKAKIIDRTSAQEVVKNKPRGEALLGYCDRCSSWSESLKEIDGETLCEDCRAEEEETGESP